MTTTLVLLGGLVGLGLLNWYMTRGVREQEHVLERHIDQSIMELQDAIHILNIYR